MIGERCARDCAFCAQARHSTARASQLSRVSWPAYPLGDAVPRVALAFERGAIQRCCLQVMAELGSAAEAHRVGKEIKAASEVPLCVSIKASSLALFEELLAVGVERVTLALDAASEPVYNRVKGRDWQTTLGLLQSAGRRFPGHVGTHIIVGLGETEMEATALLQHMHDLGIMTALFAFTPIPGTALAGEPPPALASYRRIQVARHLIGGGHARVEQFGFSPAGRIERYGLDAAALETLLRSGKAFQTSGCSGCNRPYFNERPAGPLYNYPRRLHPEEVVVATALVIESLSD
jgi:biotin synthase